MRERRRTETVNEPRGVCPPPSKDTHETTIHPPAEPQAPHRVGHGSIDLDEAARQLEQAAHDAQVAYDSVSLGDLDWADTNPVTEPRA